MLKEVSFNELEKRFERCHDEIWEGGKRDPAESFDEMSKLMFAKIYDERFALDGYRFEIGFAESKGDVANRVRGLYREARAKEPGMFKGDISVSDAIIYEVVKLLQDISLTATDLDAKGRAFEHFLGEIFRGKLGQYFTRREIVEFMVRFLDPSYKDVVIDPACGSGGFLLYTIKHVREKIKAGFSPGEAVRLEQEFCDRNIYGIEVNDRIARVAMMDMVLHDDGHSNIECNNALEDYSRFDPGRGISPGKFSLVLTNPPFGAVSKDQKILRRYQLGSMYKKRKSQKTEILFVERCLDLLKPGGRMGIVLPDGILTNSSLQYVRDFIEDNARILGVVSLPQHAFLPSGSAVKASLLFLEKKQYVGEDLGNYPVFMAIAEKVGYDATGRPDGNDLPKILEDYERFKRGRYR